MSFIPVKFITAIKRIVDKNKRLEKDNAKLRELVCRIWNDARLMDANRHIKGMRLNDVVMMEYKKKFAELGINIGVNDGKEAQEDQA